MNQIFRTYYSSPIGVLQITASEDSITALGFCDSQPEFIEMADEPAVIKDCKSQLDEYFQGNRADFNLKLSLSGTDFQNKVWNELLKVPYGKTASYKDIAKVCGNPKAVRAVGGANHNNRIAIIIPCHRIVGSSGKLTGYAGGLWRKEWLLRHEGIIE
jgi:methylated-DNA-[protein]-cysteine S-methyltransferase